MQFIRFLILSELSVVLLLPPCVSAAGSIDCRIYKVTSIASLTCGCLMGKGIEDEKHLNATDLQRKCNEKFSYSDAPVEPLSKEKRITECNAQRTNCIELKGPKRWKACCLAFHHCRIACGGHEAFINF